MSEPQKETITREVEEYVVLGYVTLHLVGDRVWFKVNPITEDKWEITVKAKNEALLDSCIRYSRNG